MIRTSLHPSSGSGDVSGEQRAHPGLKRDPGSVGTARRPARLSRGAGRVSSYRRATQPDPEVRRKAIARSDGVERPWLRSSVPMASTGFAEVRHLPRRPRLWADDLDDVARAGGEVDAGVVVGVPPALHVEESNRRRAPDRERAPVPRAASSTMVSPGCSTNARTSSRSAGESNVLDAGATASTDAASSGVSTCVWVSCRYITATADPHRWCRPRRRGARWC